MLNYKCKIKPCYDEIEKSSHQFSIVFWFLHRLFFSTCELASNRDGSRTRFDMHHVVLVEYIKNILHLWHHQSLWCVIYFNTKEKINNSQVLVVNFTCGNFLISLILFSLFLLTKYLLHTQQVLCRCHLLVNIKHSVAIRWLSEIKIL